MTVLALLGVVGALAVGAAGGEVPGRGPAAAPGGLLAAGSDPAFGFNDLWHLYDEGAYDVAAALGADTLRLPLGWNVVEPWPGAERWEQYDAAYQAMRERGIRPLLIAVSAPCWASANRPACERVGPSGEPPAPARVDDFARFAARAAQRYPEALGIEVWNEPNHSLFWRPGPQPRRYARLLDATVRAIERVAPETTIATAGLAPFLGRSPGKMGADEFLRRVYRAGGRTGDVLAAHPFPTREPGIAALRGIIAQLGRLQEIATGFEGEPTRLWVTETGVTTRGRGSVSRPEQARALAAIHEVLSRVPGIEVLLLHRFADAPAPAAAAREEGYGVVEADRRTPKPAYCALAVVRDLPCPP